MPKLTNWGPKAMKKGGGDGGKYVKNKDWKADGKLNFWLHPDSMMDDRDLLILPVPYTNDDGDKTISWARRFFTGEDDIATKFLAWLRDQEDIDIDDVVLKLRHGRDRQEFKKGELLGLKGFGFKGKILNARTESVMCVVPHDDPAVKFLAVPITAGKKIWSVISNEIEDNGPDEGNPQITPYAIKVSYDKSAKSGSDYYDAHPSKLKLTEEIESCFAEEVLDVEAECSPNGQDYGDHGTTKDILRKLCFVECPLWDMEETDPEEDVADDDGEEMPDDFGAKPEPATTDADDPEEGEDEDPESEEGEDGEDMVHPIDAGDAEEGETYELEDDTKVTFVSVQRKRAVFEDEDGKKHRLALDASVWPVEEDGDEGEDSEVKADDADDDGEIAVRDCVVGQHYLDSDGDEAECIEIDDEADEGIFKDADEDLMRYEGSDLMTSDPSKKKA